MEEREAADGLSLFKNSGIYRLKSGGAVFMDPVGVLNGCYTRFRISPSAYYSRFFDSSESASPEVGNGSRKKKRKRRDGKLNSREVCAEKRHQKAKPFLLKAYEAFLRKKDLVSYIPNLRTDGSRSISSTDSSLSRAHTELSFIGLESVWQAPLYEISLHFRQKHKLAKSSSMQFTEPGEVVNLPLFDNLVINDSTDDIEAEIFDRWYLLPRKSSFYMSDLKRIHKLIPAQTDNGFNFIVIDPPWENASAKQKELYPTLPGRYFLSLPVKQLTHSEGALVALWVTHKEKLRMFVEEELFPSWAITNFSCFYWLKVKPDGSLINELDLFHHRPYECLLLGYCSGKESGTNLKRTLKPLPDHEVIISIPADYSRKPPIGQLLQDYVPGPKPAKCIELFARELMAGWTSWGNEPLHFQELKYFMPADTDTE